MFWVIVLVDCKSTAFEKIVFLTCMMVFHFYHCCFCFRFVLLAHIGCHQMMSEESGNLRSYFECSHFSSGTIGALQVAFECDECFQCDNVSLM